MDSFGTRKSPYLCRRKQWDDISRNSVIIMKKRQHLIRLIAAALIGFFTLSTATAGGLMTNTNYHIAFDRMMARGATFDIDAAYSNPAGMAWGHEGWQLSFNWQNPHQWRDIEAQAPAIGLDQKFKGKASAPFVPGLFASYKHDRWAISAMLGIVGSGGSVTYDDGIPMFAVPVRAMAAQNGLSPDDYTLDSQVKGKQFVYGGQLNFTYRLDDHWSVAAGVRANYYDGYNRGHVVATLKAVPIDLINLQLDADQRGWGVNPIISVNYRLNKLVLTGRYEFRTKLSIPNDTKTLDAKILNAASLATGQPQFLPQEVVMQQFGSQVAAYQDGVRTRYDLPALLSLAAGYEFLPNLRATVEYHFFDDKNAKMSVTGDRQKALTHGTQEVLAGIEWDINKTFTVSCGGQRTDYGLSPEYQSNTSFACDSYSIGLGGAVNINEHLRVNAGYFCSIYSDNKRETSYMSVPVTETYSRTNNVFGLGIDYRF